MIHLVENADGTVCGLTGQEVKAKGDTFTGTHPSLYTKNDICPNCLKFSQKPQKCEHGYEKGKCPDIGWMWRRAPCEYHCTGKYLAVVKDGSRIEMCQRKTEVFTTPEGFRDTRSTWEPLEQPEEPPKPVAEVPKYNWGYPIRVEEIGLAHCFRPQQALDLAKVGYASWLRPVEGGATNYYFPHPKLVAAMTDFRTSRPHATHDETVAYLGRIKYKLLGDK